MCSSDLLEILLSISVDAKSATACKTNWWNTTWSLMNYTTPCDSVKNAPSVQISCDEKRGLFYLFDNGALLIFLSPYRDLLPCSKWEAVVACQDKKEARAPARPENRNLSVRSSIIE